MGGFTKTDIFWFYNIQDFESNRHQKVLKPLPTFVDNNYSCNINELQNIHARKKKSIKVSFCKAG